jgi:hypothetical protein
LQQRDGRTAGPVFTTRAGGELDAANVRREFRTAIKVAGISGTWSPRELRDTFVSLMSDSGVPVEEIARLAGHTNSRTTEKASRAHASGCPPRLSALGPAAADSAQHDLDWSHRMVAADACATRRWAGCNCRAGDRRGRERVAWDDELCAGTSSTRPVRSALQADG